MTKTRMSAEEYQSMKIKPHKYGAKAVERHGVCFASILEADCYDELLLLEAAGEISNLERQVSIPLTVNGVDVCKLVIDFQYWSIREGRLVWRDAKGIMTPAAALKIKFARAIYPHSRIELWPVRN